MAKIQHTDSKEIIVCLFLMDMASICQKLGVILENKAFQKLKLSKNDKNRCQKGSKFWLLNFQWQKPFSFYLCGNINLEDFFSTFLNLRPIFDSLSTLKIISSSMTILSRSKFILLSLLCKFDNPYCHTMHDNDQCVKERHSFEHHSWAPLPKSAVMEECHSFLSKGAMWEWHSYFWGEQKYERTSFPPLFFWLFPTFFINTW